VNIRAVLVPVVVAQRLLNFEENLFAFGARLALPEHHESLAASAAACFSVTVGRSAKNLHGLPPELPRYCFSETDFIPFLGRLK
jgi:hypothetical protein